MWKHYFEDKQGVIFVIDSNDRERIGEAAEELQQLFTMPEIKVCLYVSMYLCMYVCTYVCIYVYTHVRTYVCMYN